MNPQQKLGLNQMNVSKGKKPKPKPMPKPTPKPKQMPKPMGKKSK